MFAGRQAGLSAHMGISGVALEKKTKAAGEKNNYRGYMSLLNK